MKKTSASLFSVTSCLLTLPLLFSSQVSANSLTQGDVQTSLSFGFLSGKAKEFVFDDSYKLSELNWTIKNAPIVNAEFNYDITPRFSLNARGWTTLMGGSGFNNDWDWEDINDNNFTSHSWGKTNLNYANEIDLSARAWFLQTDRYQAGVLAGYQKSRFSWNMRGGKYNYRGELDDNDNYIAYPEPDTGEFDNSKLSLGYKQSFSAPYIGLTGLWRKDDVEFGALVKFSPWVQSKDNDEHYLRDATFRNKGNDAKMVSARVYAGYDITPQIKLLTEASYTRYSFTRADTQIFDEEGVENHPGGGGLSNQSWMVQAGLQYRF